MSTVQPNNIEEYAVKHKRLHPAVVNVMAPFFKGRDWSPERTRIKIIGPFWGLFSGRGSPTAVFVMGSTVYIMRGALNAEGLVRGNNWDLSTRVGFAVMAHEVFHVYQSERNSRFRYLIGYISGLWKSITRSKKLYDHQFFKAEVEAIEFQREVQRFVKQEDLDQFASMR